MTLPLSDEDHAIGFQLAFGFGTIAAVSVLLCFALLLLLLRVGSTLEEVRADGRSVREAASLSLAIREHYLHEAHTVIQRDDEQIPHHTRWLEHLQERASVLQDRVPAGDRAHLDVLVAESTALDRIFRDDVIPAAVAGDTALLREGHRTAEIHTQRATDAADSVVASLERRMELARGRSQEATRLAIGAGCAGVLTILLLAVLFSIRMRLAIIVPLQRLADAADRFGRGEFEPPIGDVGRGEIRIVSRAFDAMARQLREREKALLRNERLAAVGQLAAGVAHEINNPVAVIRGYIKTMIPEAHDEAQANELRILDQEAAACQRIVEDLLAYGRDPGLARELLGARELLEETAARFNSTDLAARVDVVCEATDASIEADRVRLRQVIDNLLSNAAHLSEPGGVVELSGQPTEDGGYRIEVADRGPGIPAPERERVFEPFHTGRRGGTGLGLAVSRVIIRAHGGTIVALPRPDGGAIMRVELPPAADLTVEDVP